MYMFLRIRFDGSMRHKRKNVCALHRITYLTASAASAASAADNQKRLRDNAGCNLPSRREVWREKSVRATLTALVTQLALNPRQSGTCGGEKRNPAVPQPECCLLPAVSQSYPHSAWNVLGCYLQNLNALAVRIGLGQSYWGLVSVWMRQHPVVFFPPLLQPHSFTVVCFKGSARLKPSPLVQAYFCKANAFLSALWYQRRGSHLCKPHFASIFSQHMSSKLFKN